MRMVRFGQVNISKADAIIEEDLAQGINGIHQFGKQQPLDPASTTPFTGMRSPQRAGRTHNSK